MPSGRVHAKATGFSSVAALFVPTESIETSLLLSMGCFMGLVVYPDLDVDIGNYGTFLIRAIFGRGVEKVWKAYWWPYSKIMPHRSIQSHLPVLSTLIRISYIGLPVILFWLFLGLEWTGDIEYILFGLIFVDTLHSVMDIISTAIKRLF